MKFLSTLTHPPRRRITPNIWLLAGLITLTLAAPGARAQTNTDPCPWIGIAGFDPRDAPTARALVAALPPSFSRLALDESLFATNWSFADSQIAASKNIGANLIVSVMNTNDLVAYSNSLAAVIQRYTNEIWGTEAYSEPDSLGITNYIAYLTTARYVIDSLGYHEKIKLCGPSLSQSWMNSYLSNLWVLGVISNIDVVTAHDYFACPGNGALTTCNPQGICAGTYAHPYESPSPGYPNLPGRIANMHYWAAVAGATNLVIFTEYGLYSGETNDAAVTADIAAANDCVLCLSSPEEPFGSLPWNHLLSNGWDTAMIEFLLTRNWIDGATLVDWRSPGTNVFLYAWQCTNNTSIVFAWAADGQSLPLSTNTAFTITDVYGTSIQPTVLDAQPVVFQTNGPNAEALLQQVLAALPQIDLPPVISYLDNQAVLVNQPLQFSVSASDPNNEPLTYTASPLPSGASLDPSTGAFSWTPADDQVGTYPITFTATDADGLSASTNTLIDVLESETDGLVGWWRFDETNGTNAVDSAGTDPGALLSFASGVFSPWASGWTSGRSGNALAFNGASDFVDLDSSLLSFTNNFSISAWINPGDAAGYGVYFCLRSTYATSGFRFTINGNTVEIDGQTTAGWNQTFFAAGQLQNNTWYHVVVVYDKSLLEFYLNGVGVPAAYSGEPYWGGDFVMDPGGSTRIGAENGDGPVGFFFNGLIEDVRAYNRTLTPAEVQALYQSVTSQFSISKLKATSRFNQTSADSCSVTGSLGLPSNYNFAGQQVTANVGGAQVSFVLDSKGRGRTGANTFSEPRYNKKNGQWTVTFTLKDGSWQDLWTSYGMANADVPKPGASVTLPVNLVIGNESFMANQVLHYTAEVGKSGTAE